MLMLEIVKIRLGISDSSADTILNYFISLLTPLVKQYCRISVIPDDLQAIMVDMVVQRYFVWLQYGQNGEPRALSSITEDKVKLDFKILPYSPAGILSDEEKKALMPYRRLWF